jgi:hypothetical protein
MIDKKSIFLNKNLFSNDGNVNYTNIKILCEQPQENAMMGFLFQKKSIKLRFKIL